MRNALGALAIVLYGWASTSPARGDDPPPREAPSTNSLSEDLTPPPAAVAEGRASFLAATEAASEQRWADALAGFERAYELTSAAPALLNVGIVLRALGRYRDARDAFDRLVLEHAEFAARVDALHLRTEVAARVGALVLQLESAPHAIRLDGRRLGTRAGPVLELEVDPGVHAVAIERDGFRAWQWEGTLADGERRQLHVSLAPLPRPVDNRSRFRRRLGISLGAIAVVVGVGLVVALQRSAQLSPTNAIALEI